MPISFEKLDWFQSEEDVTVRIFLRGLNSSKLDIFTHQKFIKLHSPPFYYEIFLQHAIDEKTSSCKLLENEVKFILKKIDKIHWDELEEIISKDEKCKIKQEIIAETHVLKETERRVKAEEKCEKKREEIRKEIQRESIIREKIETINKQACVENIQKVNTVIKKEEEEKPVQVKKAAQQPPIIDKKPPKNENKIPEVRNSGNITITFSKRNFPTPQRESQDPAEQEWLLKQHEARKVIGFVEEDLRPEERDPLWLKEKGDAFYKEKNYLGAISAYSTGIRLTGKCYDLYLNRAAAQFAQGNFLRCAEDCSKAYDLLIPAVNSNLKARIECLTRRGAALCKLGFLKEGHSEILNASKLDPNNLELKKEIESIEKLLRSN